MKQNNLDLNDSVCLHVVHILEHPTSRPTTRSTQDTMVDAPNNHLLPISNNANFCLNHPHVPAGSDSSDRTLYSLTEDDTLPIAQATGSITY